MAFTQIYVNLPVTDLEASKAFYRALGGTLNPQFTDDTSAQVILSEAVAVLATLRATDGSARIR